MEFLTHKFHQKGLFRIYGHFFCKHGHLLSMENTPAVLDTARIYSIYEALAILLFLKQSDSFDHFSFKT